MSNLPYVASRLFAAWLLVDAAQPARAQIDARTRVRDLIAQAEQARSAHDPAQAEKLLEQALRIENQPAITLQLGKLAEQEGRTAAAADLLSRGSAHSGLAGLQGKATPRRCRCWQQRS